MNSVRIVAALALASAGLVAPAVSTAAAPRPIAPSTRSVPLSGVDQQALTTSPPAFDPAAAVAASAATNSKRIAPLTPRVAASTQPAVLTAQLETGRFTAAGVTWTAPDATSAIVVQVRVREKGTWTDWQHLGTSDTPTTAGSDAQHAQNRVATEPLTTGSADAIQVRVDAGGGPIPADLSLLTVDPGTSPADATLVAPRALAAAGGVAQPAIITRAQWGADESMRNCTATYSSTIKVGFVHHTVGSNTYAASESASIMRGIYAYHVNGNGWCDVGYNFLVDRYGQIFEGRAGGIDSPVIGAHTGGMNLDSFGVAAMGTFSTASTPSAMLTSISQVLGWKLGMYGRDPNGSDVLVSAGGPSTRFPAGQSVTFRTVSGHRDSGDTECPGDVLYNQLPKLRTMAASYIAASDIRGSVPPRVNGGSSPVLSPDGAYRLYMQGDGNLVIYDSSGKYRWASFTNVPGGYLSTQADGNVVIYDSEDNLPLWTAGVYSPGAQLQMQNDGNLVLYSRSGAALWDSKGYTRHPAVRFTPRRAFTQLSPGQSVASHSNGYTLTMQTGGRLLLTNGKGAAVWSSGTSVAGSRLEAQSDGNVVIYAPSDAAVWHTALYSPGDYVAIQDDGNIVAYDTAGRALWDAYGFTKHPAVRLI
ncbi:N-acetylmuramoyl-L-alanine amidase [Lapillicoccus sp.]|uniref:N-acetylmuramoyl-L-alanine amidase n=1 Tax=Lapillicoccus sp. TaxID=1909287 RepID=UPI0039833FE4